MTSFNYETLRYYRKFVDANKSFGLIDSVPINLRTLSDILEELEIAWDQSETCANVDYATGNKIHNSRSHIIQIINEVHFNEQPDIIKIMDHAKAALKETDEIKYA